MGAKNIFFFSPFFFFLVLCGYTNIYNKKVTSYAVSDEIQCYKRNIIPKNKYLLFSLFLPLKRSKILRLPNKKIVCLLVVLDIFASLFKTIYILIFRGYKIFILVKITKYFEGGDGGIDILNVTHIIK